MVVAPAPARAARVFALLAALAVAFVLPAPSDANHVQGTGTGSPFTAQFAHGGDNAWWVEFEVKPGSYGSLDHGHVQVEGSATLHPMKVVANTYERSQQGWQKYAPQQAFNVPAGKRVAFWAGFSDASGNQDSVTSCWFTHPVGAEQCGGTSSSTSSTSSTSTTSTSSTTTSTGPSPFDATFTGVRGNEWWVQANVATNGPAISKVDVRVFTDGQWAGWLPVARQSWGWGSSYHIFDGYVVQLRATATDGQADLSSCRQWIPPSNADAAIVTCPGGGTANVWNQKVIHAQASAWQSDLSIGDADRDGKTETYVVGDNGLHRITGSGVGTVSALPGWRSVTVGDGDNDGKAEVYATRVNGDYTAYELHRLAWSGSAWTDTVIHSTTDTLGPVTIGDVDVYGGRDVFVGSGASGEARVLQAHWSGSQWFTSPIANLGDDGSFLDVWTFWVANYDGDSNLELAVLTGGRGYSNAWIVDHGPPAPNVPSQWRETRLPTHAGYPTGLTAGDADGDGKTELILGSDHDGFVIFRYSSTDPYTPAYTRQDVGLGYAPSQLFFGDGDNDGKGEVYATEYGRTVRKSFFDSGLGIWRSDTVGSLVGGDPVAGRIITGDANGDGKRDVLVASFDYAQDVGRVVQFTFGPQSPQPAFDATFSGVSGNQWWVQANVAANQPLLKVEARVNCGQVHKELTKQSWGGWAASFQVASGSKVTFRATSTDGSTDVSGGYIWPNATPTSGC